MKFGKQFTSQMVVEWQEAYMNYNFLKVLLKDVSQFRQRNTSTMAATTRGSMSRRISLHRSFSGLTSRYNSLRVSQRKDNEDEVILVSEVEEEGSEGYYKTNFLMLSDDGGEYELIFFRRLDDEFNKVAKFCKEKVEEVMREAKELEKQMDALIALRIKVDRPVVGIMGAQKIYDSTHGSVSPPESITPPIHGRKSEMEHMEVIQVEMSSEGSSKAEITPVIEPKSSDHKTADKGKTNIVGFRSASLEVLDRVKINVAPETPVATLKHVLRRSKSNSPFNKVELKKVEEKMRQAFIMFHQKIRILKSYCFLNISALSKIMKKYDKITSRNATKAYLEMVDKSYLGSSNELNKLMERVETTFIKHFSNGNRSKGMNILRPKAKREEHGITFFLGFLSGCSIALAVATAVVIHARDVLKSTRREKYMENIFPLYSLFGFIVLHMLMYAGNIYFWRRYRINYTFIFGYKQGTELGHREVFLLSFGLLILTMAGVLSTLNMEMDPGTKRFKAVAELVPLGLVTVVLLITFCPFNIIFRSSRFFFIHCAFRCLCAPLYKVGLSDFFLADQLTSQVQAFRSVEFYICYYGWGDFNMRENTCNGNDVYKVFYIIIAVVPYWMRCLQCLRRLLEEKDRMHAFNGLKYFSTIVALVFRTGYDFKWGMRLKIMGTVSSVIATIAGTYWDIVVDWGLLQRNSRNPWLRDKLLVPNKSVYFVAIVLNVILRLAWMQTVLGIHDTPFLYRKAFVAIVASLEIIRRSIWNFFRLENEHLNNVGKFRAFKSEPLPFNYDDEDRDV